MYAWVFGFGLTAMLPLAFVGIVSAAIVVSAATKNHLPLVYAQLSCITLISALIQWSIGDTMAAGLVISWSFLGPIGALIFRSVSEATLWLLAFVAIVVVSALFEPQLLGHPLPVEPHVSAVFTVMNVGTASTLTFAAAAWFMRTIVRERARSDALIDQMLPATIATRLKDGERIIADAHDEVSILFADIAGFTNYSATVTPTALVSELNALFERFDALAAHHGVEKIKTIGDAYMAACGAPLAVADHAERMGRFALAMQTAAAEVTRGDGEQFELRIGIHSGPAVSGVIGSAKRAFDLWGDAVNTASRMESHGEINRVQVSERTAELVGDTFTLQARGEIEVKGKGRMFAYFLEGERDVGVG